MMEALPPLNASKSGDNVMLPLLLAASCEMVLYIECCLERWHKTTTAGSWANILNAGHRVQLKE